MTMSRLIRRHVRIGDALIPVAFFLIVVSLSAFAAGPDRDLLARIGPGSLWVAALLASLLPVGTLIAEDVRGGALDQLRVAGLSLEAIMAARIVSHWLGFAPALLLAALLAGPLTGGEIGRGLLSLAIGTGPLAAMGVVAAALVSGARSGGAVAGIVILPLMLPVLIFGVEDALRLTAAAGLFLTALSPFAAAAALRVGQG
ncbi:MAG: heme exporter protein CcmB [Pacificimonas sp.]